MLHKAQRALVRAYQNQRVNEFQVAIVLSFVRIYRVSRAHYERVFNAAKQRRASRQERWALDLDKQSPEPPLASSSSYWQWSGFPHLPALIAYYQHLSTAYMVYILARNLFLIDHLDWFLGYQLEKPSHCYLIGYFHSHPEMWRTGGTLLASFHLVWRLTQAYLSRPYFISMFFFLVLADQDLERFEQRLAQERQTLNLNVEDVCQIRSSRAGSRSLLVLKQVEAEQQQQQQQQQAKQVEEEDEGEEEEVDEDELVYKFLKRILCYRVEYRYCTSHFLRPNRTLELRRVLHKRIAQCVVYMGTLFVTIAIIITTAMALQEFNDKQYLFRYPKCDEQLEKLNELNQLGNWSFSAHWHQLLTMATDFVETFVLWFDSGVALLFIWTIVYLLNFDTQLHWAQLDKRLQQVQARVRENHLAQLSPLENDWTLAEFEVVAERPGSSLREHFLMLTQMRNRKSRGRPRAANSRCCLQLDRDDANAHYSPPLVAPPPPDLVEAIRELQAQFYDFFGQIGHTDLLISDVISATILIWLVGFSELGRRSLSLFASENVSLLTITIIIESLSFVIVTTVTFSLLELHRNCLRSHATLCSLIAHDRSKFKMRLAKLLEFYTIKQRSAYTIFQQYPYTKTTYLSIFGWTISCFFILNKVLRREGAIGF